MYDVIRNTDFCCCMLLATLLALITYTDWGKKSEGRLMGWVSCDMGFMANYRAPAFLEGGERQVALALARS